MDLKDLSRTFVRRWYLTVPASLLAALTALGVWTQVGALHTSTATMVLIPPASVGKNSADTNAAYSTSNPLLYLGGLTDARDVVVSSIISQSFQDELLAKFGAKAQLTGQPGSQAPIMVAEVTTGSVKEANDALHAIVSSVPSRLVTLQEGLGIDDKNRVTVQTLAVDDVPTVEHKRQIEFSVAAFSFFATLLALSIALIDVVIRNRARVRPSTDATEQPRHGSSRQRARRTNAQDSYRTVEAVPHSEERETVPPGRPVEPRSGLQ